MLSDEARREAWRRAWRATSPTSTCWCDATAETIAGLADRPRRRAGRSLVPDLDEDVQDLLGLQRDRRTSLRLRRASGTLLVPEVLSRLEQQLVGERHEVGVEVTADDVAQQRAQVVGESVASASAPACSTALPSDRRSARGRSPATVRSVSSRRRSGVAQSAARRPASSPLCGTLGLEQRAQRQQMVAQRLVAGSLARSPARSGAAPRRARCRAARGGRRGCRTPAARPPARRSRRASRAAGRPLPSASGLQAPSADPRPGERAERDAPVAEQPQRAQQVRRTSRPWASASRGSSSSAARTTTRWSCSVAPSPPSAAGGSPSSACGLGDRQPAGESQLRRGDRQAVERGHERDLAGGCERRAAPAARGPPRAARGAARSPICSANTSLSSARNAARAPAGRTGRAMSAPTLAR